MNAVDRGLFAASGAFCFAVAAWLFVAPEAFYATVPGVADSGPLNAHLLRDVGIAARAHGPLRT
ncbi:MAG: hypothetical protein WCE44_13395 [Candidatus Velthaea sp.]